jgi:hypothetical protein
MQRGAVNATAAGSQRQVVKQPLADPVFFSATAGL